MGPQELCSPLQVLKKMLRALICKVGAICLLPAAPTRIDGTGTNVREEQPLGSCSSLPPFPRRLSHPSSAYSDWVKALQRGGPGSNTGCTTYCLWNSGQGAHHLGTSALPATMWHRALGLSDHTPPLGFIPPLPHPLSGSSVGQGGVRILPACTPSLEHREGLCVYLLDE